MPTRGRAYSRRVESFDHYIEDVIERGAWEKPQDYFGIEDPERAEFIRNKMRTAGRHMDPPVAVKSFWYQCSGCDKGGPRCRFHVSFTVYDMNKARAYKSQMDEAIGRPARNS